MKVKREISLVVIRNEYAEPDRFNVGDIVRIDLKDETMVSGEIVGLRAEGLWIVEEDELIWIDYNKIDNIDVKGDC